MDACESCGKRLDGMVLECEWCGTSTLPPVDEAMIVTEDELEWEEEDDDSEWEDDDLDGD